MKLALVFFSAVVGLAAAQAVTTPVSPSGAAPAGCSPSVAGTFEIIPVNPKKEIKERDACGGEGTLVMTMVDGVVKDARGRTAYIASNFQFQFDGPPQAGAIYTAGFSVCGNNSLALGDSSVWWECASGGFSNLYDRHWAEQCKPVEVVVRHCGGDGSDGVRVDNPVATEIKTTTIIMPLSDGQPQVITTTVPVPLCEITDGQAQIHTTPCDCITPTAPTGPPVSEITDGQVQVTPLPAPTASLPSEATNPPSVPGGPGSAPSAPGSVPSASVPSPSGPVQGTTTLTTATPPAITAPSQPATSAPANGADHISLGSTMSALLVGLVGVALFL